MSETKSDGDRTRFLIMVVSLMLIVINTVNSLTIQNAIEEKSKEEKQLILETRTEILEILKANGIKADISKEKEK